MDILQINFAVVNNYSKCEQLYKSGTFSSLVVCSIQVCANTMPRRKYINNDLKAIVAAHKCEIKAIFKELEMSHSAVRKKRRKEKRLK